MSPKRRAPRLVAPLALTDPSSSEALLAWVSPHPHGAGEQLALNRAGSIDASGAQLSALMHFVWSLSAHGPAKHAFYSGSLKAESGKPGSTSPEHELARRLCAAGALFTRSGISARSPHEQRAFLEDWIRDASTTVRALRRISSSHAARRTLSAAGMAELELYGAEHSSWIMNAWQEDLRATVIAAAADLGAALIDLIPPGAHQAHHLGSSWIGALAQLSLPADLSREHRAAPRHPLLGRDTPTSFARRLSAAFQQHALHRLEQEHSLKRHSDTRLQTPPTLHPSFSPEVLGTARYTSAAQGELQ